MTNADLLGLLAGALVLATFATTNMRRLRLLAVLSNIAFITYAATLMLWPVLILHALLLPVNLVMLYFARTAFSTARTDAPACRYGLPARPRHIRPPASSVRRFQPTTNIRLG